MRKIFETIYGKTALAVRSPYAIITFFVALVLAGRIWPGTVDDPSRISQYVIILEWLTLALFLGFLGLWIYRKWKAK